jgi:phage tail sheath protein FI
MEAIVVRLARDARPATIALATTAGPVTLAAADPGAWGNRLRASVDHGAAAGGRANKAWTLTVEETDASGRPVRTERFDDVSSDPASPDHVADVLEHRSALVRITGAVSAAPPAATRRPVVSANDGLDGSPLAAADYEGDPGARTGLFALDHADLFNLLVIPPIDRTTDVPASTWRAAAAFCERRRAMLIVDPPASWTDAAAVLDPTTGIESLGLRHANAAIWFPRITAPDPLYGDRERAFPPGGAVAGVMARTDGQWGVWKAPAGVQSTVRGATGSSPALTPDDNDVLNRDGVNGLRELPGSGVVVWGARTLAGADRLGSEWKYVPVRRLALYLEESVGRGLQWAVFEPNAEPLWARIRAAVEAFVNDLFRQGAFKGRSAREAYFVRCDRGTMTQADIDRGIVNAVIGVAPLRPSEFVIVQIRQIVGQHRHTRSRRTP